MLTALSLPALRMQGVVVLLVVVVVVVVVFVFITHLDEETAVPQLGPRGSALQRRWPSLCLEESLPSPRAAPPAPRRQEKKTKVILRAVMPSLSQLSANALLGPAGVGLMMTTLPLLLVVRSVAPAVVPGSSWGFWRSAVVTLVVASRLRRLVRTDRDGRSVAG